MLWCKIIELTVMLTCTHKKLVFCHLQNVSGKSGWKINGSLFLSFQWRISVSNRTFEKVVLFFLACKQVLCLGKRWIFSPFFSNRKPVHRLCFSDVKFQTEVRVTFLQTHFWYQFQAAEAVFWICANGNFFYAYINGKQSLSYGLTLSG